MKQVPRIKDVGGEFRLLERLLPRASRQPGSLLVPNGDDAAVFCSSAAGELLAVSTDCYLEGRHFRFDYSTPQQIGRKIIEASASDIVAMGGRPTLIFLSMWLPPEWELSRLESIFSGVSEACARLGAELAGGDTSSAASAGFSVTVLGSIAGQACRRSGAMPGDRVYVSGALGGAAAGLELLNAGAPNFPELKELHSDPRCRIDLVDTVAPLATAMIDISDGLASELHHLARQSGAGFRICAEDIPQPPSAAAAAELLQACPLEWALHGGDDYELLFTAPDEAADVPGFEIGRVTAEPGVRLLRGCAEQELPARGWDHFGGAT